MKRNIFYKILAISVTAVFIGVFINAFTLQQKEERRLKKQIEVTAQFLLGQISTETDYDVFVDKFTDSYTGMYLTILDTSGYVLADSIGVLPSERDQSQEPEFKQARQKGKGQKTRLSLTHNQKAYYLCYRGKDVYLRVSATMEPIIVFFRNNLPALLVGVLAAVVFSWLGAIGQSKEMVKPLHPIIDKMDKIGHGNYEGKLEMPQLEELIPLAATVNMLSDNVEENVEALEKEKDKMSFILENMNQGLILIDEMDHVVTINDRAMQILGYDKEEISQFLEDITADEKVLDAAQQVKAGQNQVKFDMDYMCEIHSCQTYHVTASKVFTENEEGQTKRKSGILFLFSNVTDQRNLVKMRQEFFANASHELKTSITSIAGFAELLASDMVDDKEKIKEYVNRISTSARDMASLVDDILKISSLEEQVKLEGDETVDFACEIRRVLRTLKPQLDNMNIGVELELEPVQVYMYKAHSSDIIMNLLSNAVKYNKQYGTIFITLKQERNHLLFTVRDTGIGIATKDQGRVFERFFKVEKSRSKYNSTGLGLSIAKHVISYYGGTIELESRLGEGTVFYVTLPVMKKKASE